MSRKLSHIGTLKYFITPACLRPMRRRLPANSPAVSERNAQHELHLPRRASAERGRGVGSGDLTKSGAFGGIGPLHARVAELCPVKQVEQRVGKECRSRWS